MRARNEVAADSQATQAYTSSKPIHRTPPPAPSGGGCLVKILLPIVAPRGFGNSRTFSSSSCSTSRAERTFPHLHSPRSVQPSSRRPTTSIWARSGGSGPPGHSGRNGWRGARRSGESLLAAFARHDLSSHDLSSRVLMIWWLVEPLPSLRSFPEKREAAWCCGISSALAIQEI